MLRWKIINYALLMTRSSFFIFSVTVKLSCSIFSFYFCDQVIKLECQYPNRIRYLTIVSAFGPDEEEQSIIVGVDWTDK